MIIMDQRAAGSFDHTHTLTLEIMFRVQGLIAHDVRVIQQNCNTFCGK